MQHLDVMVARWQMAVKCESKESPQSRTMPSQLTSNLSAFSRRSYIANHCFMVVVRTSNTERSDCKVEAHTAMNSRVSSAC